MKLTESYHGGGGQRGLKLKRHGAQNDALYQIGPIRAGHASFLTELAEDIFLTAQRLGEADGDQVQIARLDHTIWWGFRNYRTISEIAVAGGSSQTG